METGEAAEEDPLESLVSKAEECLDAEEDLTNASRVGQEALDSARAASDDVAAARALRVVLGAMLLKGEVDAAEAMAMRELDLFQELNCLWGEASMLLTLAEIEAEHRPTRDASMSECELALQYALEALDLFKELAENSEMAWYMEGCVHIALTTIYHKRNRPEEVRQAANAALIIFRSCGDNRNEARAHHGLAVASAMVGRSWDALKESIRAVQIFQQLGLRRLQAVEHLALADWHALDEDWQDVLLMAEDSLKLYRELSLETGEVSALSLVAKAHCRLGDTSTALEETKACLERMRAAKSHVAEASLLEVLAGVYLAKGDKQLAVDTTDDALAVVRRLGDKKWEANLLYAFAQLLLELQQPTAALEQALLALQFFKENKENELAANTWLHILVPLHLAAGDYKEALKMAHDAMHHFQRIGDEKGEGTAIFMIACLKSDNGDEKDAEESFKKSQQLFQDIGDLKLEAKVCSTVAGIHRDKKRFGEAVRLAREAHALSAKAKDRRAEVSAGMFAAQCHLDLCEEIASQGGEARTSRSFRAEWEKAMKAAFAGKNLARKIGEANLLTDALVVMGEVAIVEAKSKEASTAVDEALSLSRESGYKHGEASACLLQARVFDLTGRRQEASDAVVDALKMFTELQDTDGIARANTIKSWIFVETKSATPGQEAVADATGVEEAAAAQSEAVAVAVEEPQKALDMEVVQTEIGKLVGDLIGDDLEADMPFMDAGLDSLLAIQFRTELTNSFKGLGLSSTITFDYPSSRALTAHIVEKSVEALEG